MTDPIRFLFMVDIGYGCFGVYFSDIGVCTEAPPMAKWMRGKTIGDVRNWVKKKGGTMEEVT